MHGVYLVTDRSLCGKNDLENVVLRAVKGGACCVQLREKDTSTHLFVREAQRIKKVLELYRVPLIINDRIDVALACGADGVHIGQEDMPYAIARQLMGPESIIGLSVETWADVEESQKLDVNYIGVSPVFATPTKTNTKGSWGIAGLKKIKEFSRHPVVAIGGINETNAADVVNAGADCIAVVSAICASADPEAATRNLNELVRAAVLSRR
ncbi:MAG: thiamine phosphate synthase [Deltaproteobacteria bacterium HGW-Deltaproteobacteria-10]|nr:MAG: thiamine phosphate synthase [Deltaproteobacteria bacterium HGW-Deltaproteobacteria-10]